MRFNRVAFASALSLGLLAVSQVAFGASRAYVDNRVRDLIHEKGQAEVIVQMGDTSQPEIWAARWQARVPAIRALSQRVISAVPQMRVRRTYDIFPFLAASVDAATLEALARLPEVEAVFPDREMKAVLNQSGPLVGQPEAETAGFTGAGIGVAIIDTGIDYTHPYFNTSGAKFFSDLHPGYWAWRQIEAVAQAGVVGGYPDGTYRPGQAVSRDQMAVFIARAQAGGDGNVPTGPATANFSDVPTSFWAYKYIEYCRAKSIVGGYPDGTYQPATTVTRDQMAVFVARAKAGGDGNVPPGPSTASFSDVLTSFWAFKHIEYCKAQGIVGGFPDGTYRPANTVTRDQMAVFVSRAYTLAWGGRVIGGVNILAQMGNPNYTDATDPMDDYFHGTMVGGVVASMNATYRGIAPGANLVAVKVLDSTGSGTSSTVIAGIQWCITNQAAYNIKVINLSLGDQTQYSNPETCDALPDGIAIADAVSAGIVVVVASGNEFFTNGISAPACASAATSVAASKDGGPGIPSDPSAATPADGVATYSDRGEMVSMFAPGSVITAPFPDSQIASAEGTSFSAPHVAGAAAVMAQMGITDPVAIKSRLRENGVQIVDPATHVASPRLNLVTTMNPPTTGPDLRVTAVSSSAASALVGDTIPLSLTVKNWGTTSSGSCSAVVVLSKNKISSRQDGVLVTVAISPLAAGASQSLSPTGTVPSLTGGGYFLGAYVDSNYEVVEKNEVNNALTNTSGVFTVNLPSAAAVSSTIPASLRAGNSQSVTVRMKNDGTITWTPGDFSLGSVAPEGNTTWGVSSVPLTSTVAPGGTAVFTFNLTAPTTPGSYACCWRMMKGATYFGEVIASTAKDLVVDDGLYGQDFPAVSGDRVAYEDGSAYYAVQYASSEISVKNEASGVITTLLEDIPGMIGPGTGLPVSPYDYWDVSYHLLPSISGTWVAWMVDDQPSDPADPWNSPIWYFQITAYDLATPTVLPRRVTLQQSDAWFPAVDKVPASGNHYCVVWEDYRNDPDKLSDPSNFLLDNSDIYISDLTVITDPINHRTAVYPLCTGPGPQFAPRISGNLVVWEDWRDGNQADIYCYDLSVDSDGDGIPNWKETVRPNPDPAERRLTATTDWNQVEGYPDISGRTVVYCDYSSYTGPGANVIIGSLNADTLVPTPVIADPPAYRQQPRIDGTQVVWEDWRSDDADVYWTDLASPGVTLPLGGSAVYEGVPDIAGGRLVYSRYRGPTNVYNVYYQPLTPYVQVTP